MDGEFPSDMVANIDRFFKDVHPKLPKGQHLYHEVFASAMFPLQRKRELERMMGVAAAVVPRTVMEIGCDKGGGLYHFCQLPTVQKIIGCEIRGTPYAKLFEYNFPDIEFLWVGDSLTLGALRRVDQFLNKDPLDVLFIDGDKSHFHIDFDTYRTLMGSRGVVFMHDVTDPAPAQAFRRTQNLGYATEEIIDKSEYSALRELIERTGVGPAPRTPETEWENWLLHWKGRSCGVGVIYLDKSNKG